MSNPFSYFHMGVYTVRQIIRALKRDGWKEVPRRGTSHRQFTHPTKPGRVTVSVHSMKDEVSGDLLKSIERQSGLDFSLIYGG